MYFSKQLWRRNSKLHSFSIVPEKLSCHKHRITFTHWTWTSINLCWYSHPWNTKGNAAFAESRLQRKAITILLLENYLWVQSVCAEWQWNEECFSLLVISSESTLAKYLHLSKKSHPKILTFVKVTKPQNTYICQSNQTPKYLHLSK